MFIKAQKMLNVTMPWTNRTPLPGNRWMANFGLSCCTKQLAAAKAQANAVRANVGFTAIYAPFRVALLEVFRRYVTRELR